MVITNILDSNNIDTISHPKNALPVKESDILRFIVEFENTKLKEDEVFNQIEELKTSVNIIDNEKERKTLQKRLNDIQDRYRLNPFVTEHKGEFIMKYKQFGGKIELNDNKKDENIMKSMPKIDIKISGPRIKKEKTEEKIGLKPMEKIKMFVEDEVSTVSDKIFEVGLKISPPNPRREFRNPNYNNGIYPAKLSALFSLITAITHIKYPEKKKGYWQLYSEKERIRLTTDYSQMDVIPHTGIRTGMIDNEIRSKKIKQNNLFKSFLKMIKPQLTKNKSMSITNNNMERVKNVVAGINTESSTTSNMERFMKRC